MSRGNIYLSSSDKTPQEDEQLIRYDLNLQDELNGAALSSFDFVYGFTNINTKTQRGYFETATQSYEVILDIGFYDYSQLQTEITAKLNALGLGVFTVTFTDNIYSLSSPVPIKFINNVLPVGRDWIDMANFQKETVLKTSHIGGTANLAYTDAIYIICDELHKRQNIYDTTSNNNISNVLGVVYVNKNKEMLSDKVIEDIMRPKHITDRLDPLKWINKDPLNSFSVMTIRLVDERGFDLPKRTDGCGSIKYILELQTKLNDQRF